MGWFDEQIEERKKQERKMLSDSWQKLSLIVTGRRDGSSFAEGADVDDALEQLLKYFGIRERETPINLKSLEEKLDYLLSSSSIMYRRVELEEGWHKDAMGAMIVTLTADDAQGSGKTSGAGAKKAPAGGKVVTIFRDATGAYMYRDPETGKKIHVTSRSAEKKIGTEAYCFYRPLPVKKITLKDLFAYMRDCLQVRDIAAFLVSALAITLVGMIMPRLNHILMGPAIGNRSYQLLAAVMSFMFFATVGNFMLGLIRQLVLSRIRMKLNIQVQAASMMRVLSLPTDFFKSYSSGELSQYLSYINSLCDTLVDEIFSTAVTGVFSLVYLTQIFSFARSLVVPSLIVTAVTIAITFAANAIQASRNKEMMELAARDRGLTYAFINGIEKIRLSGAETRVFAKWIGLYTQEADLKFNPPALVMLNTVFTTAVTLIGTIVMYYIAVRSQVSAADYYAFNSAYAYITSAFSAIASVAVSAATVKPSLEIIRPLMEAEPEKQEGREALAGITGAIELSHVTFRYTEEGPKILDDVSLTIPARQYTAIVGRTGCGKSTLLRLLLGFETPEQGAIFYDRKDMQTLDLGSLRRHIGTVLQEGELFSGSIYENITISAPGLTLQDAWKAAEIAGLADDIRAMPMGMSTVLQEGSGGISGGQRQRIMIARAVAPKPRLLLLDEATSALDNITQKQVSDALDKMRCTRIVIAHRLSTIRHCDRILVMDGGKIVEDGTYDELIAQGGYFADLVERQRLDA